MLVLFLSVSYSLFQYRGSHKYFYGSSSIIDVRRQIGSQATVEDSNYQENELCIAHGVVAITTVEDFLCFGFWICGVALLCCGQVWIPCSRSHSTLAIR